MQPNGIFPIFFILSICGKIQSHLCKYGFLLHVKHDSPVDINKKLLIFLLSCKSLFPMLSAGLQRLPSFHDHGILISTYSIAEVLSKALISFHGQGILIFTSCVADVLLKD